MFDKDGTLFDFNATWGAWCRQFLQELADAPDHFAKLARVVGYVPETETFLANSPVVADTPDMIARRLLPHISGWDHAGLIGHMNTLTQSVKQVPTVPLIPVLEALQARQLTLGLVTNDAEAPARTHLRQAGILDRFTFIAGSDSGHGAKPDPGPLLAFAKAAGLAPEQVAMVGDSTHDLMAARAADMVSIGITGDGRNTAALTKWADVLFADIGAIPGWIAGFDQNEAR